MPMKYILFHKNIRVLLFEYEPETEKFGKVLSLENEKHIPVGVKNIFSDNLSRSLQFWWQSRLIPKNRSIYKSRGTEIDLLTSESYGFNLSDHYWIKPFDSDMTWEKGNYLTNSFNEDIGKFIVGEKYGSLNMSSNTPDLFSNGQQDKRWIINKGVRCLLKYGKPPYYEQPFNEMLSTEICRRLDIPHIQYTFVVKKGEPPLIYSSCPCFIDENTEFVPAGFVQYAKQKEKSVSAYDHLIDCCKTLGMNNIENIHNELTKMLVVDYITANVDRHFGNFGFLRNVDTLEWIGVVPVFDTGNAMFYEYPTSDIRKSNSLNENVICRSFSDKQKNILKVFGNKMSKLNLDFSKLKDISSYYKNILSQNPKLDNERIVLLSDLLEKRIDKCSQTILMQSDIIKHFFEIIKNDTSPNVLSKKITNAAELLINEDRDNKSIIEKYLVGLKAVNPEDFENKITKDINKILKRTKNRTNNIDNSYSR